VNAIDLFDCTAERMGSAPAIVSGGETNATPLTFAALAERSRRLATLFAQAGLEQGDAALVFLPVGATFFAVTAALMRAGLTAVFVDPAAWRVTLGAALAGVRVRGFVGTPVACALRWCLPELRRIPHAFVAGHWPGACALGAAASLPMFASSAACDRDSVALISFTSGTTGRPKGVLRTHSVLVATQQALAGELELREGETHLSVLPFVVLANLGAGATSVLPDGNLMRPAQLDPARLATQIRAHHVDVVVASPTVADRLATHASATCAFDSVRRVYLGGAPVLPPLLDRWRGAAPGARISVLYGATEAEPIASLHADSYGDAERRATRDGAGVLVGSPVPGVDVRILADHHGTPIGPCTEAEFAALSLTAGVEGEIVVAGPHVAPGYLGGTGNLLAGIQVGTRHWHRTSDAGYLDSSRRLWLTGRCANRTTLGTGVIHALRIEAALAGEPTVARAAFLQHGEQRLLVIEPAEPDTLAPLDQIAARIAFASPDAVAVIKRMPMDARHAAKIDYRRLEADVTAGRTSVRWPPGLGSSERLAVGPPA
jgi:acyl-CoA synthetase (AMP-forming)/AMP-acid ligase II